MYMPEKRPPNPAVRPREVMIYCKSLDAVEKMPGLNALAKYFTKKLERVRPQKPLASG
jgi:hypothetical protein